MSDSELGAGKTCFIVTPIGNGLAPLGTPGRQAYEQALMMWSKVFEPACEAFGMTVVRADKIADPGELPDQIFGYLRDADVVIADLSGGNPNVMYELGLRHSRRAITLQVGEYDRLPFDVQSIRTIQFTRDEAGLIEVRNKLVESLRAALESGPTDLRATAIFAGSEVPVAIDVAHDAERSAEVDEVVDYDEPGLLDVLADGELATMNLAGVMSDANNSIVQIGAVTKDMAARMSDPAIVKKGFAGRLLVARELADALAEPVADLEAGSNQFLSELRAMDLMITHILARAEPGDDAEQMATFLGQLEGMVDSTESGAVGFTTMRDGTKQLRAMSRELRPVADSLERGLDRFLEGTRVIQAWREPIAEAQAKLVT